MTQLTKREQIALEIFSVRGSLNVEETIDELIEFSVSTADRFLKHLEKTEPVEKEMKGRIEEYPKQPEYPRQADSPDSRPMNAQEITDWVRRMNGLDCAMLTKAINHQLRSTEGEEILTHNDIMKDYVDLRLKVKNDKKYSFHEGKLDFSAKSLKGEEHHVDGTKSEEILMVSEEEKTIDWSKQPFPVFYRIPKNTRVVLLKTVSNGQHKFEAGITGITIEDHECPDVHLDNGQMYSEENIHYMHFFSDNLAPINPTDHPLHPEFKGKK